MSKHSGYSIKVRITAILIAVITVFSLLILRVFYITVILGNKLQMKALDQWTRDIPITPKRGDIIDANGKIVATSETQYNVYLRPKNVEDQEFAARRLSEILGLNAADLAEKIKKKNVSEVTLKRKVEKSRIDMIIADNIKGVYFSQDIKRIYPYNEVLSQVLGFLSVDNVGQSGLEAYYDKYLFGTNGKSLVEGDILGHEIDGSKTYYMPPIDGLNVQLTIDITIQQIVENVLKTAMIANKPKSASCIMLDPQTGEILAMANMPTFDLNNPPRDDISTLMALSRNKIAVDIYEPGSTFKVLTAAACLEEYKRGNKNAFSSEYVYKNNARTRTIDGQTIKCWDGHTNGKHVNQTLAMALNNSCNPIFVDIAMSLGTDTYYKYIEKFGYGKQTGLDYFGESSGMLLAKSYVKNCDLARISFGQTIAVTPLQLVSATAAAINGGKYYTPHLVSAITDESGGLVYRTSTAPVREVISEDTSKLLASMLEGVVTNGSGKNAYIPGYKVGGKTGTAQKYENGHIAQGKNIMSFVGFFPADNPQYITLFIVDEPEGAGYGSTIAAPYVKMIYEQLVDYKGL